mmetsp:Transcript_136646/g.240941  ORF Transcript_136646/g.240941 Transcript_136646/m.240941 type:complete len:632 (+) Transcript_136646:138-2033(+)
MFDFGSDDDLCVSNPRVDLVEALKKSAKPGVFDFGSDDDLSISNPGFKHKEASKKKDEVTPADSNVVLEAEKSGVKCAETSTSANDKAIDAANPETVADHDTAEVVEERGSLLGEVAGPEAVISCEEHPSLEHSTPPSLEDFVGTWVYKEKYRYVISWTKDGELQYREDLSHSKAIMGIMQLLPPDFSDPTGDAKGLSTAGGSTVGARIINDDGQHRGYMQFSLDEDRRVIRSSYLKIGSAAWGNAVIAKRTSPMKWSEDSKHEDEWFEVLDTVTVGSQPSVEKGRDKINWGTLAPGEKMQVSCIHAICPSGMEYVELTRAELEHRFPGAVDDSSARGFAIVDARRLMAGAKLFMRGPLEQADVPHPPTSSVWRISEMQADKYEDDTDMDNAQDGKTTILGASKLREVRIPLLPMMPERAISLARNIVQDGWAYVRRVGVHPLCRATVQNEIMLLEKEMVKGQRAGLDFTFRGDRRIFFDTSEERLRSDIPGLNHLVETLQILVEQLGKVLERSPLGMRLTGRCRPMLARYGRGDFYLPHVDNANGDGRVLTAVYYLNREWHAGYGGRLRLYPESERRALSQGVLQRDCVEIVPSEDSLAIFQADWMVHEVTAAERERFAVTLWFMGETTR